MKFTGYSNGSFALDVFFVLLFPTLLALFSTIGDGILKFIWVAPLFLIIFMRIIVDPIVGKRPSLISDVRKITGLLVLGVFMLALLLWILSASPPQSAIIARAAYVFAALLFPLAIFTRRRTAYQTRTLLTAALASLPIFLLVNISLFLIHFQAHPGEHGSAVMLASMGIIQDRIVFPLATGVNGFGGLGGAAIVIGSLLLSIPRARDIKLVVVSITAVTSGLYVVAMTDNRGALFFALITLAAITLSKIIRYPKAAMIFLLIPLLALPFAHGVVEPLGEIDGFQREGEDNRLTMWDINYAHVGGTFRTLMLGHGLDGHVLSGAAAAQSYLFVFSDAPDRHSPHNFLLQALLDLGILGTAILLFVMIRSISLNLSVNSHPAQLASGGAVFYMALAGTVESHIMPQVLDTFPFAMLFILGGYLSHEGISRNLARSRWTETNTEDTNL